MGGVFSKPKSTSIPKPKSVAPPPLDTADQAGDQQRSRSTAREETFLTGDLVPDKKKKTLLG